MNQDENVNLNNSIQPPENNKPGCALYIGALFFPYIFVFNKHKNIKIFSLVWLIIVIIVGSVSGTADKSSNKSNEDKSTEATKVAKTVQEGSPADLEHQKKDVIKFAGEYVVKELKDKDTLVDFGDIRADGKNNSWMVYGYARLTRKNKPDMARRFVLEYQATVKDNKRIWKQTHAEFFEERFIVYKK